MLFCGEISLLIGGFNKKKREILRLKAYLAEGFHRLIALVEKKRGYEKYLCKKIHIFVIMKMLKIIMLISTPARNLLKMGGVDSFNYTNTLAIKG